MSHQSSPDPSKDVTILLNRWRGGDQDALERLMPLVVGELRRLAGMVFDRERGEHTLQPTALVNEVYLRLIDASRVDWQNRAHFFAIAGRLMRQTLVDHARSHRAKKRGGDFNRTVLDIDLLPQKRPIDLVALDQALADFANFDPEGSQVVEMRFFAGLTLEEIGEVMGVSATTVKRKWTASKRWLYRELAKT